MSDADATRSHRVTCGRVSGERSSLRSPFAAYLVDRSTQIRSDLVNAAEMKRTAAAQIEEIDRKMAALPGELETLRLQGGQEIVAEQARIRSAAAAEPWAARTSAAMRRRFNTS